ncbi:DUF1659 domain-containing protein [Desulfosporosinus meridiei]|uniref:DUF1659 domain-containing protein n=1 Tax=Desulfosporosinus meridiei (strain ATCC BAA-275 / DSM 13257 / KCTC 12902 / NCIMB 13706 / S10) TaxID=768704 RepID=J7IQG2_DESMD|nr:DUF1659 domain-containing protein [Desulfosporosinus meridiei]AFQ43845.1 Protein of unknown function (DUF1659) [Desulfosporosinus meridiei DSM 13257]
MSVQSIPSNSALVVVYQAGLTALGAPIKKQKSLNYLRFDASDQALHDAAHTLFGLSQNPVIEVLNRKTFELIEE